MSTIKKVFKNIIKYLKLFIITIFCFLKSLFTPAKKEETKPNIQNQKKKEETKKEKDEESKENNTSTTTYITGHDNHEQVLIKKDTEPFTVNESIIKKLVIKVYCEELRIIEDRLTEPQKDFLKKFTEKKVAPDIIYEVNHGRIETNEKLEVRVKEIVKDELDIQAKKKKEELEELEKQQAKLSDIKAPTPRVSPKPSFIDNKNDVELVQIKPVKRVDETPEVKHDITPPPAKKPSNEDIITPKETPKKEPISEIEILDVLEPTPIIAGAVLGSVIPNHEKHKEDKTENKEIIPEQTPDLEAKPILENTPVIKVDTKQPEDNESKALNDEQPEKKEEIDEPVQPLPLETTTPSNELNNDNIKPDFISELKETVILPVDLEETDYDRIKEQLDTLYNKIEEEKIKTTDTTVKTKLETERKALEEITEEVIHKEDEDIKHEANILNEEIRNQDIDKLNNEVENIYKDNVKDINEVALREAEDLERINEDKSRDIEKELLKHRIKKASKSVEVPFLLSLPFIRNKYFFFLTAGVSLNNHLNIIHHLLRHKTPSYTKEDLSNIKKGRDALNEAINLTAQNISYLQFLEESILAKYPELSKDPEYLFYLRNLKNSLRKQEEKLRKKEQTLEKYHLRNKQKIRKLEKYKKAA